MSDTTDTAAGKTFFVQNHDTGKFGTYDVRDEDFHREIQAEKPHFALTETQYYSFWVPEAGIHSFNWIWYHPNIHSVMAGTMTWTGFRTEPLSCEIFNFWQHMSDDVFDGHFGRAKFENGFSVHAEEPGKRIRLSYDDPAHGNSFDVLETAVSEPMMWPTSNHFEQIMHCTGHVTLNGKRHAVDCYSVRDRSWGEYRSEQSIDIPPNHWAVGAADAQNGFCITGMEDEALDPMWKGELEVPEGKTLRFGWLLVEGEKCLVTRLSMVADFDRDDLVPRSFIIYVDDDKGRQHTLTGKVVASAPFRAWMNINCSVNLTEFTWNGRTFTGEVQTVGFGAFYRKFAQAAEK